MYSQKDEEKYILDYFKDKPTGKFIDIGAFHVFKFSNTRALYELGWEGVLVEPAPSNYKAIADHYKEDPRIEVLNFAVGDKTGEIDFYESDGDAVSTSDEDHMNKWGAAGVKYSKIRVQQISVPEFMNQYYNDADFISIDTESTNIQLFRMIPDWVFERVRMIVIEHDGNEQEIESRLRDYGFTTRYISSENIILAK